MLKEKYSIEDFSELITIFEENAQKKLATDFMMRYYKDDTLIIAKFSVAEKRKGTGSQVLNWCVDFAKKENFKKIKIESVLTESMRSFCMKHEFTKDPATENLNWIKSVGSD